MKRILVVDDEEKIRKVYSSLLKQEGFEVIEAQDAPRAKKALERERVDLVLLDIKMPGTSGGELYKIMEMFPKKVKVIVASVYPVYEQKEIIEGALDYYDKSEGIEVLLSKVRKVLQDES